MQTWVPDVRSPQFAAAAHTQSAAIAASEGEAEDQAFVDAISWDRDADEGSGESASGGGAEKAGLNLSAVTQDAVRRSLAVRSTDAWLATLKPAASHRVTHDCVLESLDVVRDEPPTRHG